VKFNTPVLIEKVMFRKSVCSSVKMDIYNLTVRLDFCV
jgi:hypothetical protein